MEPTTEKATARYAQRRPSILAQDFGAGRTQHLKELSDRAPPERLLAIEDHCPFSDQRQRCRNRSVVPESPAFSVLPDATGRPAVPVTSVSPPMSSIPTPKPTSPEIIAAVSSLLSNRLSTLLPFARAAITSALLVRLLDEGASRVPWTGPVGTSSSADRESQSGGAEPVTD